MTPTVVIPAAGVARRLRTRLPRPLAQVGGETVLARQVRLAREAWPGCEVVVVLGHESGRVLEELPCDCRVVLNTSYTTTNVLRSVGLGLRAARGHGVVVLYGDLVFNAQALSCLRACARTDESAVVVDSQGGMPRSSVGVNVQSGLVTHFLYQSPLKWGQIVFLSPDDAEKIGRLALRPASSRLYGHEGLNWLLDTGGKLVALSPPGLRLVEVGCSGGLHKAREALREDSV